MKKLILPVLLFCAAAYAQAQSLVVSCSSTCSVEIDGETVGIVQADDVAKFKTTAGEHIVRIISSKGTKQTEQITLAAGEQKVLNQKQLSVQEKEVPVDIETIEDSATKKSTVGKTPIATQDNGDDSEGEQRSPKAYTEGEVDILTSETIDLVGAVEQATWSLDDANEGKTYPYKKYYYCLMANDVITVSLQNMQQEGKIGFDIYQYSNGKMLYTTKNSSFETKEMKIPTDGIYYVMVYTNYSLDRSAQFTFSRKPEYFEIGQDHNTEPVKNGKTLKCAD